MLRRYGELMNAAQGLPADKSIVIMASVGDHPVVDMLGVRGRLARAPGRSRSLHPGPNEKMIVKPKAFEASGEELERPIRANTQENA